MTFPKQLSFFGLFRSPGPAAGLIGLLTLTLVLACSPGAAPTETVPAPPTVSNESAGSAENAAANPPTGMPVESATTSTISPAAGSRPDTAAGSATPEPPRAAPTAAPSPPPETGPAPTATPSVRELSALVEANPPANTPEPEPTPPPEPEPDLTPEPEPTATPKPQIADGPLAPEPTGIYAWINSEPLTLEQLLGKVVLVDFWTYTCVNCVRTFPYLKLWHSRYADDGLVILGIHTPEFEFEKNYWNVLKATQDNGIAWPVAQDNDFATWEAYKNNYWPAKYLIDRHGIIRYSHFGEGRYAETEREIRSLLEEAGADLSDDQELPEDQELDPAFLGSLNAEVTPELYAGYQRNVNALRAGFIPYVIQETYYTSLGTLGDFVAPEDIQAHRIFLHGFWIVGPENVKHGRFSENHEDFMALKYSAKSVNAVLTSYSGEPYQVRVTLDGEYLTETNKGADIHIAEDGESYLQVEQPRLYEIVNSPEYTHQKELRLSSNSPEFELFAFTFGVYAGEGP